MKFNRNRQKILGPTRKCYSDMLFYINSYIDDGGRIAASFDLRYPSYIKEYFYYNTQPMK